jgi:hypothetical protein
LSGRIAWSGRCVIALRRTQLFNPDDLDNVKKVQDGYKVQTLSAYLKQPSTTAAARGHRLS